MKENRWSISQFFRFVKRVITKKKNIGFITIATGKYIEFLDRLVPSVFKYVLNKHNITMFIFTDGNIDHLIPRDRIIKIDYKRLGWPLDTLMRFHAICDNEESMISQDILFYIDADMETVDSVGDEILPDNDLVAVLHPGYINSVEKPYERNIISTACVENGINANYYQGCLYGGLKDKFLEMCHTLKDNIDEDFKKDHIAIWHDESHINKYFIDHPPKSLPPMYAYPEILIVDEFQRKSYNIPADMKIIHLLKNHAMYQT